MHRESAGFLCVRTNGAVARGMGVGVRRMGVRRLVVEVNAGLLLLTLARVACWLYFLSLLARLFRSHFGPLRAGYWRRSGVNAGLLLLTLARVACWLYFLSLLATVRGGTSFLCPTATKKRSKENAFPQSVLSVPSVQTTAFGSPVARCSQNHGHLKPSFSRILTSPRFATSALGQVQYFHELVLPHSYLVCGRHKGDMARSSFGRGYSRVARVFHYFSSPLTKAFGRVSQWQFGLARDHWWRSVGMSGFARRRGSTQRGSSEHRATREPKAVVCTLGTLNTVCGKAFSLLRFFVAVGQRNEVPPRTVANSDKKFSQHKTHANVRSTNPALTPDHRR